MTFVPIMWTLWGVIVASMLLLHIYRSSLEKNEDDQIFLDDSFEHEKAAQSMIVAKVNKIEPAVRVTKWLALAMTAVVVVYYARDIMLQLNIIH
jgi:anaerobic C4-dicarboxylate transporter